MSSIVRHQLVCLFVCLFVCVCVYLCVWVCRSQSGSLSQLLYHIICPSLASYIFFFFSDYPTCSNTHTHSLSLSLSLSLSSPLSLLVYILSVSTSSQLVHIGAIFVLILQVSHEGRGTLVEKTDVAAYYRKIQNWGFWGHFSSLFRVLVTSEGYALSV